MTEGTMPLTFEDALMPARRFTDTRRYAVNKWNAVHTEPIDEEQVTLFLTDEHYGKLTEEQRGFVRSCRDEMNSVYREVQFRILQYQEMLRYGMVDDLASFCRIYLLGSSARCA